MAAQERLHENENEIEFGDIKGGSDYMIDKTMGGGFFSKLAKNSVEQGVENFIDATTTRVYVDPLKSGVYPAVGIFILIILSLIIKGGGIDDPIRFVKFAAFIGLGCMGLGLLWFSIMVKARNPGTSLLSYFLLSKTVKE